MQKAGQANRIILAGPDSEILRMACAGLRRMKETGARSFAYTRQAEDMQSEDSVILFGSCGRDSAQEVWEDFMQLAGVIRRIRQVRPRHVLLVSGPEVYGKVFGEQHLLGEDEIGYLCHTAQDSAAAQSLRTAENLCFRLAKEEELDVKIVRVAPDTFAGDAAELAGQPTGSTAEQNGRPTDGAAEQNGQPTGSVTEQNERPTDGTAEQNGRPTGGAPGRTCFDERILQPVLYLLEHGEPGGVWNLAETTPVEADRENARLAKTHSPLSPIAVIPDTGKAENYAAS